jgi:hypothetical protein
MSERSVFRSASAFKLFRPNSLEPRTFSCVPPACFPTSTLAKKRVARPDNFLDDYGPAPEVFHAPQRFDVPALCSYPFFFCVAAAGSRYGSKKKDSGITSSTVEPHGTVGYEWGTYTDPTTGQPVHVHAVDAGLGVSAAPASSAPPAVAADDRDVMEHGLYEKALPDAMVSSPVFCISRSRSPTKTQSAF